ncbi:hypothetical protein BDDG_12301 [Blastomyces dermatitidis ATCC 18188]|uniref:Uncharacterized protein n=1 Tax=Ajellomyces dermatitidis (strain ATCC 18188 / CBS 674.68) TaxID=653446 RepID=A0A0J9ENZ3_AJEDA|nr:hypothetical protein BDDG_12301 [Blastomyces dermatitidis ATCC 18188]
MLTKTHLQMILMNSQEYTIECDDICEQAERIQKIQKKVCEFLRKTQEYQKRYYDFKHIVKSFKKDDKTESYKIMKKVSSQFYRLKLLPEL